MKFPALILSGLVAFSALTTSSQSAKAHDDAGAIVAGSILLGLGIAAIASERRRERRWRRHHQSRFYDGPCDRHGCYYYDQFGTEYYRGDRFYRERRHH